MFLFYLSQILQACLWGDVCYNARISQICIDQQVSFNSQIRTMTQNQSYIFSHKQRNRLKRDCVLFALCDDGMVTEIFSMPTLMMTSARVHGLWDLMLSMLMKESFVAQLGPQVYKYKITHIIHFFYYLYFINFYFFNVNELIGYTLLDIYLNFFSEAICAGV